MRKQIIPSTRQDAPPSNADWLPLAEIAMVEITSEDVDHPIESALLPGAGEGWRASEPGAQLLRLRFDSAQRLQHIRLHFIETKVERVQEFALRYSRDSGHTFQEIVRQQWNFSPNGSTSQIEVYQVELSGVTTLELDINPDISGGNAYASLAELRLA